MKFTVDELQAYLTERYDGWANEQGLFMKLVEELGEVAEVLNKRSGRKSAEGMDLQQELGNELADMIHYIVAIAAVNKMDLSKTILTKDKKASIKYHHDRDLEAFLTEYGNKSEAEERRMEQKTCLELGYPRVCAHRGFSVIAPENSMPAFGAAIALGAEEIEFDLWPTADGEIVSCHDRELERVSTGTGLITDHTLEELKTYDFGIKFGEKFKGLRIVTFEEILRKFSRQVIMNIHVKPTSYSEPYPEEAMKKIVAMVREYGCEKHAYFMLETDIQIRQFKAYAPDIPVCVGHLGNRPWAIVDRAIELGCEKVQLFKPYYNQEMIDKAHANCVRCNVFWSDDPEETKMFLKMGVDTILTNDYNLVSQVVER